jgi:hypothetical protein
VSLDTYETTQPWVTYHYGLTHDKWWPFWNSTRFLGRARMRLACMVCGNQTVVSLRIPRFGSVPEPEGGRHPERKRYLAEHAHPDRGHPMSWAVPLRNLAAHPGGMNLDLFAARLEADLNEGNP